MLHQQQMELHQAQMQYASYGMMGVCASSLFNAPRTLIVSRVLIILLLSCRGMHLPPHQRRRHRHHPVNNHLHHLQMGL